MTEVCLRKKAREAEILFKECGSILTCTMRHKVIPEHTKPFILSTSTCFETLKTNYSRQTVSNFSEYYFAENPLECLRILK